MDPASTVTEMLKQAPALGVMFYFLLIVLAMLREGQQDKKDLLRIILELQEKRVQESQGRRT